MKNDGASVLHDHRIVAHDEWLTARTALRKALCFCCVQLLTRSF